MPASLILKARCWIKGFFVAGEGGPPEILQARQLIHAIDRGGIPLNPARVNAIARNLGLEVSSKAPVEETIGRIRSALLRST